MIGQAKSERGTQSRILMPAVPETTSERGGDGGVSRTSDNAPMRGRKREDLTGRTFGYLTVIRMCDPTPNGRSYAECECVCGTVKRVLASNLKSGNTKSCGCMTGAMVSEARTKHGDSLPESRYFDLYKVWASMRRRNHVRKYVDTGKRIGVCPEWESWPSFKAWALSSGYMPGLYLARLRKDEPFSPDNCVWVSEGEPLVSPEGGLVHR